VYKEMAREGKDRRESEKKEMRRLSAIAKEKQSVGAQV